MASFKSAIFKVIAILIGVTLIAATGKLSPTQYKRNMGRMGKVIVYPPLTNGGIGIPVAPDGSLISTTGTHTSGLQEAFNYALANGYDFYIMGGQQIGCSPGNPLAGPGPGCGAVVYQVSTGLVFHPMQGMTVESGSITINCNVGVGTAPCVTIDSQEMVNMKFPGSQFVQQGSGPVIRFAPTGVSPLDGQAGLIPFNFYLMSANGVGGDGTIAVDIIGGTGIIGATIQIDEVGGPDVGIRVYPSGSIVNNTFIFKSVHDLYGPSPYFIIGDAGNVNNTLIKDNEWHIGVLTPDAGKRILDLSVSHNQFFISIFGQPVGADAGIFFEYGGYAANYNQIFTTDWGNGPQCGSADCSAVAQNQIHIPHTAAASAVSVGTSPWVYQNQVYMPQKVIISGGTVSKIELSGDASAYTDTGLTAGVFTLQPGEAVRITHTGAPTMTEIH